MDDSGRIERAVDAQELAARLDVAAGKGRDFGSLALRVGSELLRKSAQELVGNDPKFDQNLAALKVLGGIEDPKLRGAAAGMLFSKVASKEGKTAVPYELFLKCLDAVVSSIKTGEFDSKKISADQCEQLIKAMFLAVRFSDLDRGDKQRNKIINSLSEIGKRSKVGLRALWECYGRNGAAHAKDLYNIGKSIGAGTQVVRPLKLLTSQNEGERNDGLRVAGALLCVEELSVDAHRQLTAAISRAVIERFKGASAVPRDKEALGYIARAIRNVFLFEEDPPNGRIQGWQEQYELLKDTRPDQIEARLRGNGSLTVESALPIIARTLLNDEKLPDSSKKELSLTLKSVDPNCKELAEYVSSRLKLGDYFVLRKLPVGTPASEAARKQIEALVVDEASALDLIESTINHGTFEIESVFPHIDDVTKKFLILASLDIEGREDQAIGEVLNRPGLYASVETLRKLERTLQDAREDRNMPVDADSCAVAILAVEALLSVEVDRVSSARQLAIAHIKEALVSDTRFLGKGRDEDMRRSLERAGLEHLAG